jgi:membrane protease YdiL (CAAX protease family)
MHDLLKIAITPAALIAGALAGRMRMRLDWGAGLGLQPTTARHAVTFGAVFAALIVFHELLSWWFVPDATQSDWRAKYQGTALLVRVVFAVLVYPFAEELFFRGLLLAIITRKAGPVVGVVATAALFTALHSPQGLSLGALQIFADGLFFALVRLRSGSLVLPVAFHVVGNGIAVMQRLY